MLNNQTLLELYKTEKEAMDDVFNPFPSFAEWKQEYKNDPDHIHFTSEPNEETKVTTKSTKKETKKSPKKTNTKETKKTTPSTKKETKVSKADIARKIYQEMMDGNNHPVRKDVIARFMSEAGLSKAGAATYHYNIKKSMK